MAYEYRKTEPTSPGPVTAPLGAGSVTESLIADSAVTSAKIKDATVKAEDIVDGAIETAKIKAGAVTTAKLGADVVVGSIGDNSITTAKIVNGAVTADKLAPGAVGDVKLEADSVITAKIADKAVTYPKLEPTVAPTDGQILSYDDATGKMKWLTFVPPVTGNAFNWMASEQTVYSSNDNVDIDIDLDLSPFIPVTAKAVILNLSNTVTGFNGILNMYVIGKVGGVEKDPVYCLGFVITAEVRVQGIVPTDSNRLARLRVFKTVRTTAVLVTIVGYIT